MMIFPTGTLAAEESSPSDAGITEKAPALNPTPFTDVTTDTKYFLAISYLKENNLIKGYEDGSFRPNQIVSRAEALAMILSAFRPGNATQEGSVTKKILAQKTLKITLPEGTQITMEDPETGEKTTVQNIQTLSLSSTRGTTTLQMNTPLTQDEEHVFQDVKKTDWFFDAVSKGKALGIVKGEGDGTKFNPSAEVNLAQALRMMYQAAHIETSTINYADSPLPPDVQEDTWYATDMAYSASHGILMQREDGKVFPADKTLNRADLALLIYRLLGTQQNKEFSYASWYGDGLSVIRPKHNVEYVDKFLTAAHKTLPMGTIVRVTNMWNGKQVDVVINDRGPYVTGRLLDLSKSAFNAIGDSGDGIMAIQMEVIMIPSD